MKFKVLIVGLVCLLISAAVVAYYLEMERWRLLIQRLDQSIDRGVSFLENNLWDEEMGAFREVPLTCPLEEEKLKHNPDDNVLAYIFYAEYETYRNETRANMILSFLNNTLKERWIILSSLYTEYDVAEDDQYADNVTLNGIYYFKIGNIDRARDRFDLIMREMYDYEIGQIEDKATSREGHVYYKLALTSILASMLGEKPYVSMFSVTLMDLQNETDGSWQTDDLDPSSTCPNTETTILILIALESARNLILQG